MARTESDLRPHTNGSETAGGIPLAFDSEALLTIEDVAELLNVPVSWVYERTRRRTFDRIPGFRLGKYWRFREAEIVVWLEQQRAGATPHA
jgi:excisionase family DNA binding protein